MSRSHRGQGWRRVDGVGVIVGVGAALLVPTLLGAQAEDRPPEGRVEERPRPPAVERGQQEARHEVRDGDTLWELARRYLSDPLQWPEIYELNHGVVEDPHWIYPGEVLSLPADGARVAEARPPADGIEAAGEGPVAAREPAAGEAPARRPGAAAQAAPGRGVSRFGGSSVFDRSPDSGDILGELGIEPFRRSPLVSHSDFYGAAFIADPMAYGPVGLAERKIEENPLGLELPPAAKLHDRVVVRLDGLDVEAGDRLQAFRWGRWIDEERRVGEPVALLVVEDVEAGSARARVVQLFGSFQVGDAVTVPGPFDAPAEPTTRAVEDGVEGSLLAFAREQALLGQGDQVFLDVGGADGVALGDEFAVLSSEDPGPDRARWRQTLAWVRVVHVGESTATARVVGLVDTGADAGAPVRLVRRAVSGG